MTAPPAAQEPRGPVRWVHRLSVRDPGWRAAKRAIRAAVVLPVAFAIGLTLGNAETGLFASFGTAALLLFANVAGTRREQLYFYLGLAVVGGGFIVMGTACSTQPALATVSMGVVAFCVLFAGVASPRLAAGATAILLAYILPVSIPVPFSAVGDRLAGWYVAAALSIPAALLVWPTPSASPLRRELSSTARALARFVGSHAEGRHDPQGKEAAEARLRALRDRFDATPYPPTGATGSDVAVAALVGRMEWIGSNAMVTPAEAEATLRLPEVRTVNAAVASTLLAVADVVGDAEGNAVHAEGPAEALEERHQHLSETVEQSVSADVERLSAGQMLWPDGGPGSHGDSDTGDGDGGGATDLPFSATIDPAFRARVLGIATGLAADAALAAAGYEARYEANGHGEAEPVGGTPLVRHGSTAPLHRSPPDGGGRVRRRTEPVREVLRAHLSPASVWFRNSVRGAAGLMLAVAVVEVTSVDHGFWVVLAALAVLRSNALGTGATALRAVAGTVVGFAIGSLIMLGPGDNRVALWILLPVAVLATGTAPAIISFAAGQAAFTVMVVVLFNLIQPVGWKVGLVRIEDVALGCAVTLTVGLLFWPRGATAAFRNAVADAFVAGSAYLGAAVRAVAGHSRLPADGHLLRGALSAQRRLDDAFRQYLNEHGAKVVPVDVATRLTAGASRLFIGADTLATLPAISQPTQAAPPAVSAAASDMVAASDSALHWWRDVATALRDPRQPVPAPPRGSSALHRHLQRAAEEVRGAEEAQVRWVMRMLFAHELLHYQLEAEQQLAAAVDTFRRRTAVPGL